MLVHGAWHGSWCWERVTPLLDERGIRWIAPDLPTCSPQPDRPATLFDDADTIRAAINDAGGPCIVLGHSYGGAPVTQACAGVADVRRLVYLAAFIPDLGESIVSLFSSGELNAALATGIQNDEDGWSSLGSDTVRDLFYNDCDAETVAWAAARCRKMRGGSEALTETAWRTIPSTYVMTGQDRAVLPSLQHTMSRHATDVVAWDTSHSPFASRPELVADLLSGLATEI